MFGTPLLFRRIAELQKLSPATGPQITPQRRLHERCHGGVTLVTQRHQGGLIRGLTGGVTEVSQIVFKGLPKVPQFHRLSGGNRVFSPQIEMINPVFQNPKRKTKRRITYADFVSGTEYSPTRHKWKTDTSVTPVRLLRDTSHKTSC